MYTRIHTPTHLHSVTHTVSHTHTNTHTVSFGHMHNEDKYVTVVMANTLRSETSFNDNLDQH